MTITEDFLPIGPDRPGTKLDKPTSITIHNTMGEGPGRGQSTPKSVKRWWEDERSGQASAHIIIGRDGNATTTIPWDEAAYHSGCYKGNHTSIGIEVCEEKDGSFNSDQVESLKCIIQQIRRRHPSAQFIVRHYDWTKKLCPSYYCGGPAGDERWTDLLNIISIGESNG